MERAFEDQGVMIRVAGETIALSPPLIASEVQIDEIFDKVGRAIKAVA
jgi:beta-alanine--pyruvate transaminase